MTTITRYNPFSKTEVQYYPLSPAHRAILDQLIDAIRDMDKLYPPPPWTKYYPPPKSADDRAAEFMARLRERVAALDAAHTPAVSTQTTITVLPSARPAWLAPHGTRPQKRVYHGSLFLMPGERVIDLGEVA